MQVPVQVLGDTSARVTCIDDHHSPPSPSQNNRGTQPRRTATDNHHVEPHVLPQSADRPTRDGGLFWQSRKFVYRLTKLRNRERHTIQLPYHQPLARKHSHTRPHAPGNHRNTHTHPPPPR